MVCYAPNMHVHLQFRCSCNLMLSYYSIQVCVGREMYGQTGVRTRDRPNLEGSANHCATQPVLWRRNHSLNSTVCKLAR
jgi:hypothetical protein